MTFTPIMFARHSQAETPAVINALQANNATLLLILAAVKHRYF